VDHPAPVAAAATEAEAAAADQVAPGDRVARAIAAAVVRVSAAEAAVPGVNDRRSGKIQVSKSA
jgi:hypothetical protein